jgi:glycerol uptake facilitator-like aquaporin
MHYDGREILVEAVATFAFIFVGIASGGQPLIVGAALAIAVYFAGVFGDRAAHLNPAVTLAALCHKAIDAHRALALVGAQIAGGLVAGVLFAAVLWATSK